MTDNTDNQILISGAAREIDGSIWISLFEFNGLIKVDIATGFVQFIDYFKSERRGFLLHAQIVSYWNKVVFVPFNAENIAIYDLEKNELRYIPANNFGKPGDYVAGMQDGKYLYLISETATQIIQFNLDMEEIVNSYDIENASVQEAFAGFCDRPIKINREIWRISGKKNNSWKFDLRNNQYSMLDNLARQEMQLVSGCIGKDCIWIIADNGMVYQLSMELHLINQYNICVVMNYIFKDGDIELFDCVFLNDMLVIVFFLKNCIVKIPIIGNILDVEQWQCQQFINAHFSVEENKLLIMARGKIVLIDDTGEKDIIPNISQDFFTIIEMKKGKLVEANSCNLRLDNYIKYLCADRNPLFPDIGIQRSSVGKKIFDIVKRR